VFHGDSADDALQRRPPISGRREARKSARHTRARGVQRANGAYAEVEVRGFRTELGDIDAQRG